MAFDARNEEYEKNTRKYIGMDFLDSFGKADRDVPLYCGEYGVIDLAAPIDTVKWFACINAVFKKYDIGRAVWSYKEMDFGLIDAHYDDVRSDIIDLL